MERGAERPQCGMKRGGSAVRSVGSSHTVTMQNTHPSRVGIFAWLQRGSEPKVLRCPVYDQYSYDSGSNTIYQELEKRLLAQNVFSVYAGVTASDREDDAFVTDASIRFHEKTGYTRIGEYHLCGNKFGQWYSVAWFEKALGIRLEKPASFIPFSALNAII
ncbi:MAG: hypothetical protein VZR73_09575 [Acutalibacteraceae bacterium]|nr:hypothetical protein [Acutalibacteraceae bacterium]